MAVMIKKQKLQKRIGIKREIKFKYYKNCQEVYWFENEIKFSKK